MRDCQSIARNLVEEQAIGECYGGTEDLHRLQKSEDLNDDANERHIGKSPHMLVVKPEAVEGLDDKEGRDHSLYQTPEEKGGNLYDERKGKAP